MKWCAGFLGSESIFRVEGGVKPMRPFLCETEIARGSYTRSRLAESNMVRVNSVRPRKRVLPSDMGQAFWTASVVMVCCS